MEKSVKNAVFKGFPVLMESGPLGSKQYSQTTNEEKNNFLSSYFKVYYLVSKCTGKRVADRSAIDTALILRDFLLFICDCYWLPPGSFENYPLHILTETGCSL